MKKLISILTALALAVGAMAGQGQLQKLPKDGGGGLPTKDSATGASNMQFYPRGWKCSVFTETVALSGTSTLLNISSAVGVANSNTTGYLGPYAFYIQNVDQAKAMVVFTTQTSSAIGDTQTAKGIRLPQHSDIADNGSKWFSGPLAQGEFGHARGLTGTVAFQWCGCHQGQ